MTSTQYARRGIRAPANATSPWRHVDLVLLIATLAISAIGVLMVYSSTRQSVVDGADPTRFVKRQALFLVLGILVMVGAMFIDYRVLRDVAPLLWVGMVFVLLLVLSPLGASARGAHAWFPLGPFNLEPSELAKIVVIVCVSAYCAANHGALDTPQLLTVLGLAAAPMTLIYLQPDLGTDLVFAAIVMGMLLVAGARVRHILMLSAIGALGVVTVFQLGVLKQYQLDRLAAFLDPQDDPRRSAYNLRQSQIAIAHGGVAGRGVFKGTQTNLSFVPEQHTDFIFTAVGEELGFVGAATLLALFGLVMWRTWRTAVLARDDFGTLLCVGVLSMFVFQVFENVGMTMGITPIAGIPLPFMSYGGSALISCFLAIGLIQNVHMRRFG